ncbi:MAG: hypothetical protein R2855_13970 [Thermomicrobiales bacterium]
MAAPLCQAARNLHIDMNVLMTLAILGALLLGTGRGSRLLPPLFAIGNLAQSLTFDRTRSAFIAFHP